MDAVHSLDDAELMETPDAHGAVLSLLWRYYYRPENIVPGLSTAETLQNLGDPYTRLHSARQENVYREGYFGPGFTLDRRGEEVIVTNLQPKSSASSAGIRGNDVVREIDDWQIPVALEKSVLMSASERMSGERATPVSLLLRRGNNDRGYQVQRYTQIPSVWLECAPGQHIAHLRIASFRQGTSNEVRDCMHQLPARTRKLVLNLCDCPGGLIEEGVAVASELGIHGTVQKKQRKDGKIIPVECNRRSPPRCPEIAVAVNAGTASMAEALAAACRDRLGAALVGQRSYGKGTFQVAHRVHGTHHLLRLTEGRWLTPNDDCIDQIGLLPDIPVEPCEAGNGEEDPILQAAADILLSRHSYKQRR